MVASSLIQQISRKVRRDRRSGSSPLRFGLSWVAIGLVGILTPRPAVSAPLDVAGWVAQQATLDIAICRQQWQTAIDLTAQLTAIPQLNAAQRQAYVDLRHRLEALQSRSPLPGFVMDFDDPRLPPFVSQQQCEQVQAKVNANHPEPPTPVDRPIDWPKVINEPGTLYNPGL